MNTVEWIRGALLRCSGSLSPERQCRFSSIQHLFVNDSSELNVSQVRQADHAQEDDAPGVPGSQVKSDKDVHEPGN